MYEFSSHRKKTSLAKSFASNQIKSKVYVKRNICLVHLSKKCLSTNERSQRRHHKRDIDRIPIKEVSLSENSWLSCLVSRTQDMRPRNVGVIVRQVSHSGGNQHVLKFWTINSKNYLPMFFASDFSILHISPKTFQ